MNDCEWTVEIITEHDRVKFTFYGYDAADDFMRAAWYGLTNAEERVVQIAVHKEMP